MKNEELLSELERYKEQLTASEARAKKAEDDLRDSREKFAKAEQIASIGYWSFDLKTNEVNWSDGHFEIFGYRVGESKNYHKLFRDRVHPEDIDLIEPLVKKSIENNQPYSIDYRIVMPDRSIRHIHEEADKPATDSAGRRIKLFGIVQDITEHKNAEQALQVSEEKYRTIVETASEGICIIKDETSIIFTNKKFAEMLSYTQAEMMGENVYTFTDPEYHEILRDNLRSRRLGVKEQYDYKLRCKDGRIIWITASGSPLYTEKGEFLGSLAMVTDITDRKLADEQIKASLKEKEALLKEIHHRVKNNLQIISSLLSLQNSVTNDEKYRELLRDSQNRIKSMALLHELLYKSKDLSSINISEYINSLISYISRSYQHYSSHSSIHIDVEDIYLDIEKAINVGIIVTELISNSIKYAFPESMTGEIRVDLHRKGSAIILTISDNGIGLPEDLDIHNMPTLGLQLVEILAQQLEGTLEIDRAEKTSFTICFSD